MGASCSPDLVNLYAFYYEFRFLTQATQRYRINRAEATFLLAKTRFFRRFLDDIILCTLFRGKVNIARLFTLGNLVPGILGIYPRCLDIQDTSLEDQSTGHFMDLHIRWHPSTRIFTTAVFDKRKSPQYRTIPTILTVPSAHSCLSETCKLAVIFSQLWRFRTLCNTVDGWLEATVDFCARFRQAGYDEAIFMPKVFKATHKVAPFLGCKPNVLRDRLTNALRG